MKREYKLKLGSSLPPSNTKYIWPNDYYYMGHLFFCVNYLKKFFGMKDVDNITLILSDEPIDNSYQLELESINRYKVVNYYSRSLWNNLKFWLSDRRGSSSEVLFATLHNDIRDKFGKSVWLSVR
jgi:hypothetical protein